jgi:hypothetical protein
VKCQRNVSFKATVLMLTLKKVFDFGKVYGLVSNISPRISGKMSFTIEDKTLNINNELINNRFFESGATNKTTVYSKYT